MPFLNALSLALILASVGSNHAAQSRDSDLRNVKRIKSRSTEPAPLVIPPSQYWDGIDGLWSSIALRVGTPAQDVRVLVSTAAPETMVVLPQGCTSVAIDPVPADCASSRGGLFDNSTSSTWEDQGYFGINGDGVGLEANLGYSEAADYGLETLGLGYVADGPTLENMTVAGIATTSPFYLGVFGLSTQPLNYSHIGNYSAPSYFSTLRSKRMIPSLSWSYTAGANYRLKSGQLSQLIFGGYDTSRFTPNSATFSLVDDITRDIVVGIQSISYMGTTQSDLLENPIYAFIDSTDPNIWLPEAACKAFETAFGITIDNSTGLYMINDTHYAQLQATNPEVTFTLANTLSGGDTVNIVLPFGAFALPASPPFTPNDTHYFPLRVAETDNQTTLGRSFLQEAYLTVDYERQNFSVSQCTWIDGTASEVVSIFSPSNLPNHPRLRVGIIVGAVLAAISSILLGASAWFYYRKRKASSNESITKYLSVEKSEESSSHTPFSSVNGHKGFLVHENVLAYQPKPELSTSTEIYQLPERMYGEGGYAEEVGRLDWQRRAGQASELTGSAAFYELDARPRTPAVGSSPNIASPSSMVLGPREIDPTRLTSPLRNRRWI